MRECEWWYLVQKNSLLKKHVRKNVPYKLPLGSETLLMRIQEEKVFGHVECDLEVPEELRERFANFHEFSKTVTLEERIYSCWNMLKKLIIAKTTTNVSFELQIKQWNSHNTIIKDLFEAGSPLYQNSQIP